MTDKNKQLGHSRRQRVEQLRAQQRQRERRRIWGIYGITGALTTLVLGIVVAAALGIRTMQRDQQTRQDAARAPIDGMQKSEGLGRDHVQGDVDYPQSPPVGGNHNPAWLSCGAYTNHVLPHPRSRRWNTALSGSPTARTCPTTKSPGSRTSPPRKATRWSRHPQTRIRRSSLALGDFSSTSRPPTTHAGDLPREVPPRPPDARTRCGVLRWT